MQNDVESLNDGIKIENDLQVVISKKNSEKRLTELDQQLSVAFTLKRRQDENTCEIVPVKRHDLLDKYYAEKNECLVRFNVSCPWQLEEVPPHPYQLGVVLFFFYL